MTMLGLRHMILSLHWVAPTLVSRGRDAQGQTTWLLDAKCMAPIRRTCVTFPQALGSATAFSQLHKCFATTEHYCRETFCGGLELKIELWYLRNSEEPPGTSPCHWDPRRCSS